MASFFSAIENRLRREQEELEAAEDITKEVFPVADKLTREQLLRPIALKVATKKIKNPEYRDAFYGLCCISNGCGPEGCHVILDEKKVESLLDEVECDYDIALEENKKFILGLTKKIVGTIKKMARAKVAVLCYLVNDVILQKVINTPSPDKLKTAGVKIKSLDKKRGRGKSKGRG